MIHVIRGRIGANEKINTVETKLGCQEVVHNTIYVWDGRENSKTIPVRVEAWGETAKKFAQYKKGEIVSIVGRLQSTEIRPKGEGNVRTEVGYRVLMVDEDNKVFTMSNEFFMRYLQSKKRSQMHQAEAEGSAVETDKMADAGTDKTEKTAETLQLDQGSDAL